VLPLPEVFITNVTERAWADIDRSRPPVNLAPPGKERAVNPLRSTQSMDLWGYFRLACIALACVFILLS
jgi:hypothetical protein